MLPPYFVFCLYYSFSTRFCKAVGCTSVCFSKNIPHLHHESDVHDEAHNHAHSHDAANGHGHVHENTQAVLNRLSRAIGHLESVRKMVADGRDCSEVLIQIAAVRAAITNIGKVILQDHIQHCIVDAVEHDDEQALDALCQAIDKFVK